MAITGEPLRRSQIRLHHLRRIVLASLALYALPLFQSCSPHLGYGVLLWSIPEKSLRSGTVVSVYIKSNINSLWVVGLPGKKEEKVEIPLWQLHFEGSRKKTQEWADSFAPYANSYAETLLDGLPVRDAPDNVAHRVYRLREGQIVKVLKKVEGAEAITGGHALPGDWYKVLTDDGSTGYTFSYRLRLFEPADGDPSLALTSEGPAEEPEADATLDSIISKVWRPESYKEMIDDRQVDLSRFSLDYGFFPGKDSGVARIVLPDMAFSFPYTGVSKVKEWVYQFDGSSLQVTVRRKDVLGIQFTDKGGAQKSHVFVSLPLAGTDYIEQELERRAALFKTVYATGPAFRSENYGSLSFIALSESTEASAPLSQGNAAAPSSEGSESLIPDDLTGVDAGKIMQGRFTWVGYDLLVPTVIPERAARTGSVLFKVFLGDQLAANGWDGVLSLVFDMEDPSQPAPTELPESDTSTEAGPVAPVLKPTVSASASVDFLYSRDTSGIRLEYLPPSSIARNVAVRRSASPTIVYFSRLER